MKKQLAERMLAAELTHHLASETADEEIAKDGLWSDSAVKHSTDFLKNWMIDDHIIRLNMLMKPALQAHGYTFWPG